GRRGDRRNIRTHAHNLFLVFVVQGVVADFRKGDEAAIRGGGLPVGQVDFAGAHFRAVTALVQHGGGAGADALGDFVGGVDDCRAGDVGGAGRVGALIEGGEVGV